MSSDWLSVVLSFIPKIYVVALFMWTTSTTAARKIKKKIHSVIVKSETL